MLIPLVRYDRGGLRSVGAAGGELEKITANLRNRVEISFSLLPISRFLRIRAMDAVSSSAGLVQMHPTASRSHVAPLPAYAVPSPAPSRPSLSARSSRSSSSAPTRGASSPAAGLHLNPAQFPLYSTLPHAHPIRVITAAQYAQIHHEYTSLALPEKVLMPWSHLGADVAGTTAASYFGFARGDAAAAPKSVKFPFSWIRRSLASARRT